MGEEFDTYLLSQYLPVKISKLIKHINRSLACFLYLGASMCNQPRIKYHESKKLLIRAINKFQQEDKPTGH